MADKSARTLWQSLTAGGRVGSALLSKPRYMRDKSPRIILLSLWMCKPSFTRHVGLHPLHPCGAGGTTSTPSFCRRTEPSCKASLTPFPTLIGVFLLIYMLSRLSRTCKPICSIPFLCRASGEARSTPSSLMPRGACTPLFPACVANVRRAVNISRGIYWQPASWRGRVEGVSVPSRLSVTRPGFTRPAVHML